MPAKSKLVQDSDNPESLRIFVMCLKQDSGLFTRAQKLLLREDVSRSTLPAPVLIDERL